MGALSGHHAPDRSDNSAIVVADYEQPVRVVRGCCVSSEIGQGHWRSRVRISTFAALLVAASVTACGTDDPPAEDTVEVLFDTGPEPDTQVEDTAPDDTTLPDTAPEDAPDTAMDTAVDTAPQDTFIDPFAVEVGPVDPIDQPEPSEPLACPTVVNGDAESDDLTGWTVTAGSFDTAKAGGVFATFPEAEDGTYYFFAGENSTSRMAQTLDVSDQAEAIDAGGVVAQVRLLARSHSGRDVGYVTIKALDESGEELLARENGSFADEYWRERQVALELPVATRSVVIELRGVRDKGNDNDAYFDKISICLHQGPAPAIPDDLYAPPYLMHPTADAMTVLFESRRSTIARVDYGLTEELGMTIEDEEAVTNHELRLEGLEPGTRYFYRVSWDDTQTEIFDFKTAHEADNDARIEFVMFADNQDGPERFQILSGMMAALDPDFALSAGDCVQNGTRPEYRTQLFEPLFGLGNTTPLLIGAGNHETYSSAVFRSSEAKALYHTYMDQAGDEHCFGFRSGPLFVVVIDTEELHKPGADQYDCIVEALESDDATTADFRTAIFHRPPLIQYWDSVASFPSPVTFYGADMDAPDVRQYLAPLFEQHNVDLVFNGHNHLYAYAEAYPQTVSWVTSGGGGGGLESGVDSSFIKDWSEYVDVTLFGDYHFLHVAIDNSVMAVRAITMDGDVLHSFYVVP